MTAIYNPLRNIKNKKAIIITAILCIFSFSIFSRQPDIQELSDFTIWEILELREAEGFSNPVLYRTTNLEGGVKVRVLKIGKEDIQNEREGKWLYVLITTPMWVESGEWIKKHSEFRIFLPSDAEIYDYNY